MYLEMIQREALYVCEFDFMIRTMEDNEYF